MDWCRCTTPIHHSFARGGPGSGDHRPPSPACRGTDRSSRPLANPLAAPRMASVGRLDTHRLRFLYWLHCETLPRRQCDMALVRWEPVRELSTLQNEMNRL